MSFLRLGIIGDPVGHSLSPLIHGYWLKQHGIAGGYDAVRVHPDDLNNQLRDLINKGYRGLNVTLPHKETILDLCDHIDDSAARIGAANTLRIDEAGAITAFNTDLFGFAQNLRRSAPDFMFKEKAALVIGAGGGARAVIHALRGLGVGSIQISNRTLARAEALARATDCTVCPWDARSHAVEIVQILVNTSALGMAGQPPLLMPLDRLHSDSLVADIVYKPLWTDLLRSAQTHDHIAVTGIGMLLYQAQQAFHLWTNHWPDIDDDLIAQVAPS